jgi:hypothetical protein
MELAGKRQSGQGERYVYQSLAPWKNGGREGAI